jgi:putrescine aminotransferase
MFGCETYSMEPDLLTFAKAVTNGFQPLGGVMVSEKVADIITADGGEFGHGFTYSGHPIACAAALATLNIMQRDKFVDHVANDIGPYLQAKWAGLADHPIVGHVRGVGMLGSIELVRDKESRERLESDQKSGGVCREFCVANGLIMRAVGDSMIISPPFVTSHQEIDLLIARATKSLDQTADYYAL